MVRLLFPIIVKQSIYATIFFTSKKMQMKKNYRITNLVAGKILLASALTVLLAGSSLAQGNRRGGERGNDNWRERSNQSQGRRNDVAIDRPNRYERQRNDGEVMNRNRNGNGDWNKNRLNDNPGNRNRN